MLAKVVNRYRALSRQGGFSIIEVVVSAVLVATTATGTFFALDSASKTNQRNARNTVGHQVGAAELERLRRLGDTSITQLLQQDQTVRYTTVKGVVYRLDSRAYYKAGIGSSFTTACGDVASSSSSGAKYVYISVQVSLPPGNTSATGATGASQQVNFMDTYFATEGGDLQTASGTLRVYVKGPKPSETPKTSATVQLYKSGVYQTSATTNDLGCVLFVGLTRGAYEVRVPTTTEIDKYGNTNPVKLAVAMPSRGALTRTINMAAPVLVNLNWYTRLTTGDTTRTYVTPGASGISNLVGPYTMFNTGFTAVTPSSYIFRTNGTNMQFYPSDPTEPADSVQLYAGSCIENDPDDGNGVNGAERVTVPVTGGTGWSSGSTYSPNPELLVPQFRIRVGQGNLSSWANGGKVQVKMTATNCGAYPTGGAAVWKRLTGSTDSNGYLPNNNYVLPAGTYEVCVRHDRTAGFWPFTYTEDYYGYASGVTNPHPGPNNYSYATNSTSTCGSSSLWSG